MRMQSSRPARGRSSKRLRPSDNISFHDRMPKRIPLTAWLLFLITAFFYIAILNFYQVASDMMQNTGKFISSDKAGLYMSVDAAAAATAGQLQPAHSVTATAARSPRNQCAHGPMLSCTRAIAIAIPRFALGPHSPRRSASQPFSFLSRHFLILCAARAQVYSKFRGHRRS